MIFKKKEKPSQAKVELMFSKCEDNINDALKRYENERNKYVKIMAKAIRENRHNDAALTKETLRVVLIQQTKMNKFFNQFLQVKFLIEEAFIKNQIYSSLGNVLSLVKNISASSDLDKMIKDLVKFEKSFTKASKEFDSIMGIVDGAMSGVSTNSVELSDEIQQMVDAELSRSEDEATYQANNIDLFKLD